MNCMVTCMYSLTNYWQTCTNDCIHNNITFDPESYAHPNMITLHSLCSNLFECTGSCNSHRAQQFAARFVGCRASTYVATCKDVGTDAKSYPVIYRCMDIANTFHVSASIRLNVNASCTYLKHHTISNWLQRRKLEGDIPVCNLHEWIYGVH